MLRAVFLAAALVAAFCLCRPACAARGELLPETTLARDGLVRPWFVQVELDERQSRLEHVVLCDGVLYAQTSAAMIHAIDAETGRTIWSRRVGRRDRLTMAPDANGDRLAVVNGLHVYVLNRFTGEPVFQANLSDAPGDGPSLSSQHVYVPMVSGMVVAYPLKLATDSAAEATSKKLQTAEEKGKLEVEQLLQGAMIEQRTPPLFCRSYGRAMIQPLVTRDNAGGEYTVWPTDRGYLNLARIDHEAENTALILKYRLDTGSKILARPGYLPPEPNVTGDSGIVFVAAKNGVVYAIAEEDGSTLWRFTTGECISQSPAVVDDRLYVATEYGGMYCLDCRTGQSLWQVAGPSQFVAASKDRVYATDRLGRILILDAASGASLTAIAADRASKLLANTDTDRIYLVSDGGLIQCLRETERTLPMIHAKERKEAAKAETVGKGASAKERPAPKAATPKAKPATKKQAR